MLNAAVRSRTRKSGSGFAPTKILAVTLLTSIGEAGADDELHVGIPMNEYVTHWRSWLVMPVGWSDCVSQGVVAVRTRYHHKTF